MQRPENVLETLATTLREERSVISPLVGDAPAGAAGLGALAAAGPRATAAPLEYALLIESVREGYLLHYESGRVVVGADPDLGLLAGDYLYALGLERLAGLGDLEAVRMLSDLISLAAQIHDGERSPGRARHESAALWLAVTAAIGGGAPASQAQAIDALRRGFGDAAARLYGAAAEAATAGGFSEQLGKAADSIDFRPEISS